MKIKWCFYLSEELDTKEISNSLYDITKFVKGISHPKRLQLLVLLLEGTQDYSRLIIKTGLKKTALSNHLSQLMESKLVNKTGRGNYHITTDGKGLLIATTKLFKESKLKEQLQREKTRKNYSNENIEKLWYPKEKIYLTFPPPPPYWTSFITALSGLSKYYGYSYTDSWLAGASGHAFVINIHDQLCPSSPYCFPREEILTPLLENLGFEFIDLGFVTYADEKILYNENIKKALDEGHLLIILNSDNQVITGYDDTGFLLQPSYVDLAHMPSHLTFKTWEEYGSEIHVNAYVVKKIKPVTTKEQVIRALERASTFILQPNDINKTISIEHDMNTSNLYKLGVEAYNTWIDAVNEGWVQKNNWGHKFNSNVIWELRRMASEFLSEAKSLFDPSLQDQIDELVLAYKELSIIFHKMHDNNSEEILKSLLTDAKNKEMNAIEKVIDLIKFLK